MSIVSEEEFVLEFSTAIYILLFLVNMYMAIVSDQKRDKYMYYFLSSGWLLLGAVGLAEYLHG